jgi:RNA polymerase sigma-70 factor, ECF subfamily
VTGARRLGTASAPGRVASEAQPRTLDPASLPDHVDRLFRAAWALSGSRDEAEDLVQETFARVLAKPRVLRNDDDIGYLLRVLRNTFYNRLRAERRRPLTSPLPEDADLVEDRTGRPPDAIVEAREVYSLIAGLPDDFRDVIVAVDVTGLSYREAARALRVPEGTIMSRLYRARRQVAERLGD